MPAPMIFAENEAISATEQILSSHTVWEDRIALLEDDICPDSLSDALHRAMDSLLNESYRRGVALDWSTTRSYVQVHSAGQTLITRADVL